MTRRASRGIAARISLALLLVALAAPVDGAAQEGDTAAVRQATPPAAPLAPSTRFPLPGDLGVVIGDPADSAVAAAIRAELEARPDLPALPPGVPIGVEILLATDEDEFRAFAGGLLPEWSAGIAIPSESRIVLPLWGGGARNRRSLTTTVLRHEWAHVGLHQYLEGRRVPRWFSEGYAQWAAGWDRSSAWRLRLLMAAGRTPPLDSLSLRFPRGEASVEVAYLLSATMVEFLVDVSGPRGIEVLLENWRDDGRFEVALARTYGFTPARLETAWKRWLRDRYGWLYILGSSGIGWGLLAGMLLLLFRVRRRRDREGMARLRASDVDEDDPYWMPPTGPPVAGGGIFGDETPTSGPPDDAHPPHRTE